jgi:3-deoxy-manno-octulosonate cytidylyltransferase (CMP-KDO synthetase)
MMTESAALPILIPARMQASRLPGKPLADIAGKPMIIHVWERAMAANIGPVIVATDAEDIAATIRAEGGTAVMTDPDLPSGSDRIYEALCHIDPDGQYGSVINLQGDLPEIDISLLRMLADMLSQPTWDLVTLSAECSTDEAQLSQIVKAVIAWQDEQSLGFPVGNALYFSRAAIPDGPAPFWHHIGLYGWRRDALARFISLPPSPLELSEKLEQLRALENGMNIGVGKATHAPGGIDTEADLIACRARFEAATKTS